jgi:predicted Zn-dependent peptidase
MVLALLLLQESFTLDNGMKVVLVPAAERPIATVVLAVTAGVYTEPEGRCGISHVLEHLFFHGPTNSFASPHETLSRDGPMANAWMDANAETMWRATYFYAARPKDRVEEALAVFAEKMDHVKLTGEILDAERPKVLEEIRNVEHLRPKFEKDWRYPKAGIAADVEKLTLEDLEAYRATHYRPDRAVLVIVGDFDVDREKVTKLFGAIKPRESKPLPDADSKFKKLEFAAAGATAAERAALRVAGEAWQEALQKNGLAYVEVLPNGGLRAVQADKAPGRLVTPLSASDFRRARTAAGAMAKMRKSAPPKDGDPQRLAQAAIDRALFEVEGGQEFLDALDALTIEDVTAAAAKYLK